MKQTKNFSRYFTTEDGHIYSLNYKRTGKTKIMKPAISTDGYLKTVLLDDGGKYHTIAVHRFIALVYFGEKPFKHEVNHKNGIKTDNRVCNLEYITHQQNVQHSYKTGLQKPKNGSANHYAKLNEDQVTEIRRVAESGGRYYGRKELAMKFGVAECTIKDIVTRRRNSWYHV
jgi:hypothetical protein